MAGADPKGHRADTKTGDVVHVFTGGSIQILTDVSIDPASNVWAANNWNVPDGATGDPPAYPTSTWRFGLDGHLWGGSPGEAAAHGQSTTVLTSRVEGDQQGFATQLSRTLR